jgi:hypothetical protein
MLPRVIVFLELWKRKEKDISLRWGTHSFENEEPDRPEFKGKQITSFINGQPTLFFPDTKKNFLLCQSSTVINLFAALIIGAVTGIYILRFHLYVSIGGHASLVASALNSIQIVIFNMIYKQVAVFLNNYENHRTATGDSSSPPLLSVPSLSLLLPLSPSPSPPLPSAAQNTTTLSSPNSSSSNSSTATPLSISLPSLLLISLALLSSLTMVLRQTMWESVAQMTVWSRSPSTSASSSS